MFDNKLVAVVNKQVETGRAMNALAHMALGFGARGNADKLNIMDYQDAEGNEYPNISKNPFIILKAKNSNKILDLIKKAKAIGVRYTVFTDTMIEGTWEDQVKRTKEAKQDDITFYGVLLYGPKEIVTEMTKKLSLWN